MSTRTSRTQFAALRLSRSGCDWTLPTRPLLPALGLALAGVLSVLGQAHAGPMTTWPASGWCRRSATLPSVSTTSPSSEAAT